jgi:hypothetical protein
MGQEVKGFGIVDYCQYLLSSQTNYTITNLANHLQTVSHDLINTFLRKAEVTPELLWENLVDVLQQSENGYIIFDDTVLDKDYSRAIELVRRQYSGNAKRVIRGIGLVTCIYYNPNLDLSYVIDYRIYDKDGDGKNKHDHVQDMLRGILEEKMLSFTTVLMDCWYATIKLMAYIDNAGKTYYCPIKKNRLLRTDEDSQYQRADSLIWQEDEEYKLVRLKGFLSHKKVKLFPVAVSTNNTEYIITNETKPVNMEQVKEEYGKRWKVELFYRELKQTTGIERCQCRKEKIQRNHIGCALLVWTKLKLLAYSLATSVYDIKRQIMTSWLSQDLKHPRFAMTLA